MQPASNQPLISDARTRSFQPMTRDHHIIATRRTEVGDWWHDRGSRYATRGLTGQIQTAADESFQESQVGFSPPRRKTGAGRKLWESHSDSHDR